MATSLAYITKANPSRSGATYTANSVSIGTADTNRRVIVAYAGGGIRDLSSATIGGISATVHGTDTSGNGVAAFFSAIVPTGTTANIVATASSSDFFDNYFIVWTIDDTEIDISSVAFVAMDISSQTSSALSYTGATGGVSLAVVGFQNGNSAKCPITINNSFVRDYEDDFDGSLMGASLDGETAGSRTTTISWSGSYSGESALIMIPLAAASGSTGTSATTNAADTSSASGTTTVRGTSTTTNAADTSTASGTTTVRGTSTTTNAADTSAATGTTTVIGSSANSNNADTSNASGSPVSNGSSATTNAPDVSAASGSIGSAVSGSAAITEGADTSTASGTTTILGTSANTNNADTSSAQATTTVLGTISVSETGDTANASGSAGNITGTVSYTNNPDTAIASGVVTVPDQEITYGGWAGGNIIRQKPRLDDDLDQEIPKEVKEIVVEVAKKAVEAPTTQDNEQALLLALEQQKIAFKQAYFSELKKEMIREYLLMVQAQQFKARKEQERTIVMMMMSMM